MKRTLLAICVAGQSSLLFSQTLTEAGAVDLTRAFINLHQLEVKGELLKVEFQVPQGLGAPLGFSGIWEISYLHANFVVEDHGQRVRSFEHYSTHLPQPDAPACYTDRQGAVEVARLIAQRMNLPRYEFNEAQSLIPELGENRMAPYGNTYVHFSEQVKGHLAFGGNSIVITFHTQSGVLKRFSHVNCVSYESPGPELISEATAVATVREKVDVGEGRRTRLIYSSTRGEKWFSDEGKAYEYSLKFPLVWEVMGDKYSAYVHATTGKLLSYSSTATGGRPHPSTLPKFVAKQAKPATTLPAVPNPPKHNQGPAPSRGSSPSPLIPALIGGGLIAAFIAFKLIARK